MKKINWGTGIVIAFVLFIGFILYFVIKTTTDSNYEYDLVAKDYYKDELEYQQRIDKLNNAKKLETNINVDRVEKGITVNFPTNFSSEKIKGTIYLYRPSDKILDVIIPISLKNSHSQFISDEVLISGRWDLKIEWNVSDETYLFQHSINY